jgi:GGDEF domain-containing protein
LVDFGLRFNHKGRHYFKAANGEDIALSLSIGAAMFNGHPDYERLIQIADEALYIAKDEVETVLNSVKPVFRCARMQR